MFKEFKSCKNTPYFAILNGMLVLGIETSCDETACAIVRNGSEILANVIYSQIELHRPYGGVFPELACRRHVDVIVPVIKKALSQAKLQPSDLNLIAVTKGPGLIGALLIGLNSAKTLSLAWKVPFIGINHVEAHLYAAMMPPNPLPVFPCLGLVISGGHTFMVKIEAIGSYRFIGTTQDDAIGEAFDKVAQMLGLSYPGGPSIEALAKTGNPKAFAFKPCRIKGSPWDFSFSGLKTSVLYAIKGQNPAKNSPLIISEDQKKNVAASFQETALNSVVLKAIQAADAFNCKAIVCGGGVTNNQRFRDLFSEKKTSLPLFFPSKDLTVDNAAMIAGLGYHNFLSGQADDLSLEPMIRIPLWKNS